MVGYIMCTNISEEGSVQGNDNDDNEEQTLDTVYLEEEWAINKANLNYIIIFPFH